MNTCELDFCDKLSRTPRGRHCEGHYYQKRRGKTFSPLRKTRFHEKVAPCAVDGCDLEAVSHYKPLCPKHSMRVTRHGDVNALNFHITRGPENPNWAGVDAGYSALHQRVRNAKGHASDFDCVECGKPAKHWAYDHQDPEEVWSTTGSYSFDIEHYISMCVSCHKIMDLKQLK